ncbi:hypothetical protein ACSAGD_09410 [Paramicrobacterium sp. CJ85]|uniref:hypothetical protein n=1 Tax=Paramicrobacterium sp. CJ85 TaxID=3445355 RepID=UPI003F62EA90
MTQHPRSKQHQVSRRSVLNAGAWSVPVIAVAAATPAAAASISPDWSASEWFSRYRTDKQLLTVSFAVDQPQDELDGYYYSYSLTFASAPQAPATWTPDIPTTIPYDEQKTIVDSYGPWPSGLPDPATMDGQTLNITVTVTKPGEIPIVLTGSDSFRYWDND